MPQSELLDKIVAPANIPSSDKVSNAKEEKELFDITSETAKSKHTKNLTILSIWVLGTAGLLLLLIRIYHFLTPTCWQWLNDSQIQTLDKLLFSGTLGSILGKYSGSIFSKEK
ncbi:hypothetical protein ACS5PU_08270 [Pedobacter sp. GSP4]|uniref:hypothetical protein n=1 Tax=Pedobacter sp. GSP4 TaxID=3453716 RepID=UPI003EEAF614